ncbi:MAG: hypothetical protein WCX73_00700 [Candidatus Pacearchaeota archaeon]|jgi:hypothetical protein
MDKERIQRQAKQILDNFADALACVEKESKEDSGIIRDEFERKEGNCNQEDNEFRTAFLKNSSSHDDDFIIAEKGSWKL